MDVSAKRPAGPATTVTPSTTSSMSRSARRRRPSGQSSPLPHHLRTTGVGWLVGAVVSVVVSLLVFARGLQDTAAVAVTVVDDAVVGWFGDLEGPGLVGTAKVAAALGSWV